MIRMFPKELRVIEVKSIDLQEKDMIVIERFDDFLWLTRNDACVWKLKEHYYSLTDTVAYVFFTGKEG